MRTAVAAPEDNWRRVYGVVRPGQFHPFAEYPDDYWEAFRVSRLVGGTMVVRWETRSGWEAV